MRKLLYLFAGIGLFFVAISCDKVAENPGDFSLKSSLMLGKAITTTSGATYELKQSNEFDSVYEYFYNKYDTLKDEKGEPVIGPDGKIVIHTDTLSYFSKRTGHIVDFDTIVLSSIADTFSIEMLANCRWKAPVPSAGGKTQWYYNYNLATGGTSLSGGGNGVLNFRTTRNKNKMRVVTAKQIIISEDSTAMYRLYFRQAGEKD